MATKKDLIMCRGINSPLLKCTGTKKETDFYENWNLWDNNYTCFCKSCLNKIYDTYLKQSNSEKVALYYTCLQINMPFMQEVYDVVSNKTDKNGNKISVTFNRYVTELQKRTAKKMIWKDFSSTDVKLEGASDNVHIFSDKELEDLEKIWGMQDNIKDYEFLEDTYDRYTNEIEEMTVQQQDLYRDLCRDRLLLRKLSENGYQDNDMITKIQTRLNTLMKTLKIDNFESNQKKTLSELSFIEKCRLIEEHDPLEVYGGMSQEDYDIDKRKKYYTDLVLRPLCNTLAGHKDFNIDMTDLEQYNLQGDK